MYLYIICAVIGTVSSALAVLKNMHMFQLNSYKAGTHLKWIKKFLVKQWSQMTVIIFALLACFFDDTVLHITLSVVFIIFIFANKPLKGAKKPLVYTSRVYRMLASTLIIYVAIIFLSLTFLSMYRFTMIAVSYALTPLIPVITNGMNFPIEALVRRWYVRDAMRILQSCKELKIVGITGSYGKTSMKYYLSEILRTKYETLMTPHSFNTPMGISKTIREELRATHEVFVCEMGLKYMHDIKEVCDIVNPEHGILTAIGPAHLETMGSIENIIKTKFELADAVKSKGMLFANGDNEFIMANMREQKYLTYGLNHDNDFHAYDVSTTDKGTTFSITYKKNGEEKRIENLRTQLIGYHNVLNLTGAVAFSIFMGVEHDNIRQALKKIVSPPHRLQLIKRGDVTIIDDAYNSNPSGSKAALDVLALFGGYKILITPGMVELGSEQESFNHTFGVQAASVCDYVVLVGEKQTIPIRNGLLSANFDQSKIFTVSHFKDGIDKAYAIQTEKQKILLLENDLPDQY